MIIRLLVLFLVACPLAASASIATLEECQQVCIEAFPTTPVNSKIMPGKITFDNTSDQGEGKYHGTACVLFGEEWEGKITKVVMNGETALKGVSYKGRPVFRFLKTGDKYPRPLKFVINTTSGDYVYTSGSATSPTEGKTESVSASSCGNPTGDRCRQNFRFSHSGSYYGNNIKVYLDGVLKLTVANGETRTLGADGIIWKPVSDNNGKLVLVGPYGKKFKKCTIKW